MSLLMCDKVVKRFGGLAALNSITIRIEEGERVGLIGPNGSGKTTLFNCITSFYKTDGGRITFRGRDITNLPPNKINYAGINRTFQIPRPFSTMTVHENIITSKHFGSKGHGVFEPDSVLDLVGLKSKSSVEARQLNVQERKMLDLARALVTEPKLLLVDEVTAGLTDPEADNVANLLLSLNEEYKVTLLVVEHIMRFLKRIATRTYVLNHGEMLFEGPVEDALSDDKVVQAYLGEKMVE